MKKKILLSSILTIALCFSLFTGATYALFTSEDTVNIAVTSGKVEVVASVEDVVLYSMGVEQTEKFENGGTAEVEGGKVSLNLLTPGDKVSFNVVGENNSNVSVQYRVKLEVLDGYDLAVGLKISIGEKTYEGLSKYQSAWTLVTNGEALATTAISIELPKEAGNEYQNLTSNINVVVEAVQGNAEVEGVEEAVCFDLWNEEEDAAGLEENTNAEEKVVKIDSAEQLAAFAANVNAGTTYKGYLVTLEKDVFLNGNAWTPIGPDADAANKFYGTFDGQGHTIYDLYVSQEAGYHAAGLFGALNGTVKNLIINGAQIENLSTGNPTDNGTAVVAGSLYTAGTIENVKVYNATVTANRYVGGIVGYAYGNVVNCLVENSSINAYMDNLTGSLDNGDKVGGIAGYYSGESAYKFENNQVVNCKISAARDVAGLIGVVGSKIVSFENNKVVDAVITYTLEKDYGAASEIVTQRVAVEIPASNTFENVTISKGYVASNSKELANSLENGASEVTLTEDVTLTESVVIPSYANTVLNLNGQTFEATHHKNDGAVVKNEGTLTITGGVISSAGANGGSAILNNGTLIVENATLNGAPNEGKSWPSYTINNTGTLTITDTLVTSVHGGICSYGANAVLTLENVTLEMSGIPGFTSHGIYTYNGGKVIVKGGNYANNAADQNSTGGSVINGNVEIYGGTFTGRIEAYYGTPVIYGGTFSVNPSKYVASGYKATQNANGLWEVTAE